MRTESNKRKTLDKDYISCKINIKQKQSEEGIDEVPPPVIPYDFTVDEPQQLETQYVTEIEEMTEEPTERLVKETNVRSQTVNAFSNYRNQSKFLI